MRVVNGVRVCSVFIHGRIIIIVVLVFEMTKLSSRRLDKKLNKIILTVSLLTSYRCYYAPGHGVQKSTLRTVYTRVGTHGSRYIPVYTYRLLQRTENVRHCSRTPQFNDKLFPYTISRRKNSPVFFSTIFFLPCEYIYQLAGIFSPSRI